MCLLILGLESLQELIVELFLSFIATSGGIRAGFARERWPTLVVETTNLVTKIRGLLGVWRVINEQRESNRNMERQLAEIRDQLQALLRVGNNRNGNNQGDGGDNGRVINEPAP